MHVSIVIYMDDIISFAENSVDCRFPFWSDFEWKSTLNYCASIDSDQADCDFYCIFTEETGVVLQIDLNFPCDCDF